MTLSFYFTCSIFLIRFILLILAILPSPIILIITFLYLVVYGAHSLFLYVGDMFSYLLFIVYVGGLLVLLIYLIILSRNYTVISYNLLYVLFIIMGLLITVRWFGDDFLIIRGNSIIKSIEFSGLLVLGGLLTFVFLYVCSIISLGGISVNVGKIS